MARDGDHDHRPARPAGAGDPREGREGQARRKTKPAALARARLTLHGQGAQKVTLRLTRAGRRYFATHHGTVSVHVALTSGHRTVMRTIRVRVGTRSGGKHKRK